MQYGEWSTISDGSSIHRSILIVGLGNPLLGDDGVGWIVANQVAIMLNLHDDLNVSEPSKMLRSGSIDVVCLSLGGLALMERLIGYKEAIIIDSINTGINKPGTVECFSLSEIPNNINSHLASSHDTSLQNAIRVGETMGAELPEKISIVGIEIEPKYEFSETLSPAILQSIPDAVTCVMELIQ